MKKAISLFAILLRNSTPIHLTYAHPGFGTIKPGDFSRLSKEARCRCCEPQSSTHAEAAMAQYLFDNVKEKRKYTLVIVRIRADGSEGESMPCRDCMPVLRMCQGYYKNVYAMHDGEYIQVDFSREGIESSGRKYGTKL